jgi:hypothetical protein
LEGRSTRHASISVLAIFAAARVPNPLLGSRTRSTLRPIAAGRTHTLVGAGVPDFGGGARLTTRTILTNRALAATITPLEGRSTRGAGITKFPILTATRTINPGFGWWAGSARFSILVISTPTRSKHPLLGASARHAIWSIMLRFAPAARLHDIPFLTLRADDAVGTKLARRAAAYAILEHFGRITSHAAVSVRVLA